MKKIVALLIIVMMIGGILTSCMTNRHTIGNGPETGVTVKSRQWYALWGLIRIGDSDTRSKVGDAQNYEIKTYYGFVDYIINFFLGIFSIQSRTIKVTK